jgi:hypothetical protein
MTGGLIIPVRFLYVQSSEGEAKSFKYFSALMKATARKRKITKPLHELFESLKD